MLLSSQYFNRHFLILHYFEYIEDLVKQFTISISLTVCIWLLIPRRRKVLLSPCWLSQPTLAPPTTTIISRNREQHYPSRWDSSQTQTFSCLFLHCTSPGSIAVESGRISISWHLDYSNGVPTGCLPLHLTPFFFFLTESVCPTSQIAM